MNKKIISVLLAVIMSVAFLAAFKDVPSKHWAYDYINRANKLGIVNGYGNNTFGPDDSTEKEQMAAMLYRTLQKDGKLKSASDFSEKYSAQLKECKISDWAQNAVSYGFEYGLWSKDDFLEKGAVGGKAYIKRDMIAKWMFNCADIPTSAISVLPYKDASSINASSYGYLDALYRFAYLVGSDDGSFHPSDPVIRSQTATICVRLYDNTKKSGDKLEIDNIFLSGKASAFNSGSRIFSFSTEDKEYKIQIASDAKILIDGKAKSFSDVQALAGKKIVLASIYGESPVLIVQTMPRQLSGSVTAFEKRSDYTLVKIKVDGVDAPYFISASTEGSRSLSVGDNVKFIADGCELLEVVK